MDALKLLGRLDGLAGFPLAQPNLPIQPNPAGHDVDMVVVSVLMTRRDVWHVPSGKLHPSHEIPRRFRAI
jgi:predicted sugar kinase